jgi:hypothetical protein
MRSSERRVGIGLHRRPRLTITELVRILGRARGMSDRTLISGESRSLTGTTSALTCGGPRQGGSVHELLGNGPAEPADPAADNNDDSNGDCQRLPRPRGGLLPRLSKITEQEMGGLREAASPETAAEIGTRYGLTFHPELIAELSELYGVSP